MISLENEVFDIVEGALHARFPDMGVYPEFPHTKAKMPCATVIEVENNILRNTRDSSNSENHAIISYEINIYSNLTKGRNAQCREIAAVADEALQDIGFSRTMMSTVPSIDGATIFRLICRYQAVISKNNTIYRR